MMEVERLMNTLSNIYDLHQPEQSTLYRVLHPDRLPEHEKKLRTPVLRTSVEKAVYHQKDKAARAFFRNPKELAEFVNNELYDGFPFTCAQNIRLMPTDGPVFDERDDVIVNFSEKVRDVFACILGTEPNGLKKTILFGLEIQSDYYEYMNARVDNYDAQAMLHDAMLKKKVMDWDAFQRLPEGEHFNYLYEQNGRVEIVTFVLYLNCDQGRVYPDTDAYVGYDSCDGLHAIDCKTYHSVNPLNMSDSHIEQYSMRQRIFYKCMKHNRDGEMFERIFNEHPEYGMDRELVLLLNSYLNITIPVPKEGETTVMCEAVRQMNEKYASKARTEGIAIGEARGITIGEARGITIGEVRTTLQYWKEGFIPKERAMKDTGLSEEELDQYATTGTCSLLQA